LSDRFLLYALLELETPLLASAHAMIIGSKLDTDLEANMCRIAFHGTIIASYQIKDLAARLRIFRKKTRVGRIERVVDNYTLLVKDLFKKETNVNLFIGKTVVIKATGNIGKIDAAFGKSGKVKVHFSNGVNHMPNQQEE
jgi:selenocysteine-specific elongation factor